MNDVRQGGRRQGDSQRNDGFAALRGMVSSSARDRCLPGGEHDVSRHRDGNAASVQVRPQRRAHVPRDCLPGRLGQGAQRREGTSIPVFQESIALLCIGLLRSVMLEFGSAAQGVKSWRSIRI